MQRRELKNLAALTLIQAAGAVLPVLVFPYLFHVLTAEAFSQLVLAESISLIVVAIVLYSFEVTGVSRIIRLSIEKDSANISRHFNEVLWTRLALWAMCILAIFMSGLLVKPDLVWLIVGWSLVPLGYIFQSSYFYQGTENNVPHCVIVLVSRAIAVCSVYGISLFWNAPACFAFSIGLCYLSGGLASLIYLLVTRRVGLCAPSSSSISHELKQGWHIFIGNLSVILFRDSNVLILNALNTTPSAIALYSVIEKLIKAFQASVRPLNMFFYTKAVALLPENGLPSPTHYATLRKFIIPQHRILGIGLACGVIVYALAIQWLPRLVPAPTSEALLLSCIMISSIFFGIANFILGTAGLNNLNEKKFFSSTLIKVGLTSLIANTLLIGLFSNYGAACGFTLGELMLFLCVRMRYHR